MFRRKLTALDYHNPAGFNCKDETEFRNFIVWLEDQKIRHYKIEDRGDAVLNEAAQILRLLHIEELRELQTKINEAIVAVQAIIADPKTDHRLGKVGR
ncbi:RNA transcription, translation and transport factor protein-like [Microtus oregoni]|uniref:RNA transcription, translation and transport factor protein-like n=1 Tax=Microtus oregoni TaxID=111838 RepID=UPI001BB1F341|nr:RNA transcription, translation and transport factor protein-like [Microtus oregoni]